MTNAELISAVTDLEKEVKYLELENMVFTHFLEKNDPSLLEGFINIVCSFKFGVKVGSNN